MKVVIQKSTGKFCGSCSSSLNETLIAQTLHDYPDIPESDLEVQEVTEDEWKALIPLYVPTKAEEIAATDTGFIRVCEDLIDTLISKGIIALTDLPPNAQNKYMARKTLRHSSQ